MATREQEFADVRGILTATRELKEQKPSPKAIIDALNVQDQLLFNAANNSKRPWTVETTSLTTVANQAEYTLSPTNSVGKVRNVHRLAGDNVIMPVPFAEFPTELDNQAYEFVYAPVRANLTYNYTTEKMSFHRTSAGGRIARLYPIPEEAGLIYIITYFVGAMNAADDAWLDEQIMPEFSFLKVGRAARSLLPSAEWVGFNDDQNREKRREILALTLQPNIETGEDQLQQFLRSSQHESIDSLGYWYEPD